ncbi:MAG: hypothetical protein ACTHMS_19605 [Jatrophihabitans sp.]|uniref:hypothetical protein n=1 Tax=Jatrophihabitans sp. TaxID=1932789 RepID=UPI003F80B566
MRWNSKLAGIAAMAVVTVQGVAPVAADAAVPRIIDLGTLPGGSQSDIFGTDDHGLWVGASDDGNGDQHAVLWQDGRIRDLGVPTAPPDGPEVWASDVNHHDVIVANGAESAARQDVSRAYVWRDGQVRPLPMPPGADANWSSFVRRIDDEGTAVGSITDDADPAVEHPVVWPHGGAPRFVELPAGYDGGAVLGIDDRGDLVGQIYNQDVGLAVRWDRAGHAHPLGSADQDGFSQANVVDEDATAAGVSDFGHTLPGAEAVTWRDGTERGLGFFPGGDFSWVYATNGHGAYAGVAGIGAFPDDTEYVMIVRCGPHPVPLTLLPLSRRFGDATGAAHAVSADLTVGGDSETADGEMHATLWTHAFDQGFVPGSVAASSVRAG